MISLVAAVPCYLIFLKVPQLLGVWRLLGFHGHGHAPTGFASNTASFAVSRVVQSNAKFMSVAVCALYVLHFWQMQIRYEPEDTETENYTPHSQDSPILMEEEEKKMNKNTWSMGRSVRILLLALMFSGATAFKYASASEPQYVQNYLTMNSVRILTNNSILTNDSILNGVVHTYNTLKYDVVYTYNTLSISNTFKTLVKTPWIQIFCVIFAGQMCVTLALVQAIHILNGAAREQQNRIRNKCVKLRRGGVTNAEIFEFAKTIRSTFRGKDKGNDHIPTSYLLLIVLMLVFVGVVEGGTMLAACVMSKDLLQELSEVPGFFWATLGTVVPITVLTTVASDALVTWNETLSLCKKTLKHLRWDFVMHQTALQKTGSHMEGMGIESIIEEIDTIHPLALFSIPLSKGSNMVVLGALSGIQLASFIWKAVQMTNKLDGSSRSFTD